MPRQEHIALRAPESSVAERHRLGLCLASALALHALTSLVRWPTRAVEARPSAALGAGAEVDVALIESPLGSGAPPGGGSDAPQANAPPSAPEQPIEPRRPAPRVPRAEVTRDQPSPAEVPTEPDDELSPAAADLLAAVDGSEPLAPRPRAARKLLLDSHSADGATAEAPARQEASPGRSEGTGLGVNGGPGGNGRGNGGGVIGKRFALGGPSGAFRADVCFIEPTVKSLLDITSCPIVATFFTDLLNIAPRRFNQGFPGISERTEWFAIKYRGKFRVTEADVYTFRLISDDGSQLSIDGYPIIDNDGQHQPRPKEATITLEAGEHEFSLFYYQGPAEWLALQLFVKRFQGVEQLFGPVI